MRQEEDRQRQEASRAQLDKERRQREVREKNDTVEYLLKCYRKDNLKIQGSYI